MQRDKTTESKLSPADKARVRKDAERHAKAAEKRREKRRRRDANDPKAVHEDETGEEPLDTQVARTWGAVHEENEGERRQRLLHEREETDELVPARRPLDEDEDEIEEAAEPLTDRQGHRGGFA